MLDGALPNLVVIGAMKCGTTSLHHYLDQHPDVAMSRPKELNFFVGREEGSTDDWHGGNWHRGTTWYAAHFDPAAAWRGEASPGYTSPSHPEVAGRMAASIPEATLVYAVRDPVSRAVSQYAHHRREGTETRDVEEAVLDPDSQYVARSRYFERLAPFLETGAFDGRVVVVAQEELQAGPRAALRVLFGRLGVGDGRWSPAMAEIHNRAEEPHPVVGRRLRDRVAEAVRDDAERLRAFAGRDFPGWTV